jgi:hypothetical protein
MNAPGDSAVDSLLARMDIQLHAYMVSSELLFRHAFGHYVVSGRGAVYVRYGDEQDLGKGDMQCLLLYLTEDEVSRKFEGALDLVEQYDPQLQFVFILAVTSPKAYQGIVYTASVARESAGSRLRAKLTGVRELRECVAEEYDEAVHFNAASGALLTGNTVWKLDGKCSIGSCTNGENLRLCTGCRQYRYCSRACQKIHWREGHKQECASA